MCSWARGELRDCHRLVEPRLEPFPRAARGAAQRPTIPARTSRLVGVSLLLSLVSNHRWCPREGCNPTWLSRPPHETGFVTLLVVVHPCGPRPSANAYLISGPGVLSLDRACRGGGVARHEFGGISPWFLPARTDQRLNVLEPRVSAASSMVSGRRGRGRRGGGRRAGRHGADHQTRDTDTRDRSTALRRRRFWPHSRSTLAARLTLQRETHAAPNDVDAPARRA